MGILAIRPIYGARGKNVARSKTSRGEGLVPRWGRGGAWQNPPCQFAVPSHNSGSSYLGVPAPAGMSDWYESMSRTPIRDAPTPLRLCLGIPSIFRIVIPAPHSSFRRRPESRGAGRGKCSAGACPPLGSAWGLAESAVPIRRTKPQLRLFIPWCAGASRHEQLVRKHVPDSDPARPYAASIVPRNPINLPYRHSGESRNPEGWGEGNVVRSKTSRGEGLVPRWGRGGAGTDWAHR